LLSETVGAGTQHTLSVKPKFVTLAEAICNLEPWKPAKYSQVSGLIKIWRMSTKIKICKVGSAPNWFCWSLSVAY